ncbi:MAG: S-layer homology domain-containing protein [bacterium]
MRRIMVNRARHAVFLLNRARHTVPLLLAMVLWAGAAAAQTPSDTPTDHWAYKSVKELLAKGYFSLYDDGTFKGDKPVDRLTMVNIVTKLIDEVNKKQTPQVSVKDLQDLKKLAEEFKDEIIDFKEKNAALDTRLSKLEEEQKIMQQDLTRNIDETEQALGDIKDQMAKDKKELLAKIDVLTGEVKMLRTDFVKEKKANRRAHSTMWLGIVAALVVGLASN